MVVKVEFMAKMLFCIALDFIGFVPNSKFARNSAHYTVIPY